MVGGFTGMGLVLWISLGQSFSTTMIKSPKLAPVVVEMCGNNGSDYTTFTQNTSLNSSGIIINSQENPLQK